MNKEARKEYVTTLSTYTIMSILPIGGIFMALQGSGGSILGTLAVTGLWLTCPASLMLLGITLKQDLDSVRK